MGAERHTPDWYNTIVPPDGDGDGIPGYRCGTGCRCEQPVYDELAGEPFELRFKSVGKLFHGGTADNYTDLDLVVKNLTEYTPWNSSDTGRNTGQTFASISMAANRCAPAAGWRSGWTWSGGLNPPAPPLPHPSTTRFEFAFEDASTRSTTNTRVSITQGACAAVPPLCYEHLA